MPTPDALTTIGYVFTAEDMSSEVVNDAQKSIEAAEAAIGKGFERISKASENTTSLVGRSLMGISESFRSVFMTDIVNAAQFADERLDAFVETIKGGFAKAWKFAYEEQLSFFEILQGTVSMLGKFKRSMLTASVNTGGFLKQMFALEKVTSVMSMGGGLFGALLGPFGPILSGVMKLFQPLLDIIVETLSPAMETFTALLKPAFAPLGMLAEIMAQQLAPLVAKFLSPVAALLEIVAVHIGSFLAGLLDTNKAMGPLAGFANKLFPILREIGQELMAVGEELLPELMKAAEELAPIFLDLFIDALKAVKPLIKPLAELAAIMVGKVLPAAIKLLAHGFKVMIPVIAQLVEGVATAITWLNERLTDFFGDLQGHLDRFYDGFIDPILQGIADVLAAFEMKGLLGGLEAVWSGVKKFFTDVKDLVLAAGELILEALGFGEVDLSGMFTSMVESVMTPIKAIWSWLEGAIFNTMVSFLEWDPPIVPGGTIGEILGIGRLSMPALAEGGIARGATEALIGEAGPEAVVPLEPEAIERFITPVIPEMDMPGLEAAVALLDRIDRALRGTLKVEMAGGREEGGVPSRHTMEEESELDSAIGMGGF